MNTFEPGYQDHAYIDSDMYIKVPDGDWKVTFSMAVDTGETYEVAQYGDTDEGFDETTREMPPEVRAQFDAQKPNATQWLQAIRMALRSRDE